MPRHADSSSKANSAVKVRSSATFHNGCSMGDLSPTTVVVSEVQVELWDDTYFALHLKRDG